MLRIGKGEEWSGGRNKPSILAGAFEAVLGGVYQDGGYEAARTVVERFFTADVTEKKLGQHDYKTQASGNQPDAVSRAAGLSGRSPRPAPIMTNAFVTEIAVGGKMLGIGEGESKKQSEQEAAKKALHELQKSGEQTAGLSLRLNIPIGGVTNRSCPNSRQMY